MRDLGAQRMFNRLAMALVLALSLIGLPAAASAQGSLSETYTSEELLDTGHQFFGSVAQGLASLIERSVAEYGQPNAYILGQEGSGALFAGARYGDGTMYTRNAGEHNLFWQGPSLGLNFGADGSRVMMLVYNLPSIESVYERYPGIDGSLYAVGGLGMTALRHQNIYIVPISAGIGIRAGISIGYLKFTREPTWNPF
jgi:hypothetical protein